MGWGEQTISSWWGASLSAFLCPPCTPSANAEMRSMMMGLACTYTKNKKAGGLSHPRDNLGCEPDRGVHVQPKRGRGMMFYNLLPDGWGDKYSMHTACPIKNNAQKWAANKWVRNEPFRD